jgi:hypothetical protein
MISTVVSNAIIGKFDKTLLDECPELRESVYKYLNSRYKIRNEELNDFLDSRGSTLQGIYNGKPVMSKMLFIDMNTEEERYVFVWHEEKENNKLIGLTYSDPWIR